MNLSFKMKETMEGYHELDPGKRLPLRFDCVWGPPNLNIFLDYRDPMFLTCILKGTISAEGLCQDAPISGLLYLNYPKGNITYEFTFNVDGKLYLFTGQKVNIKPWNLLTSHTTCFHTIIEPWNNEKLVSTGVTFFKLKNALDFVTSFRLNRA